GAGGLRRAGAAAARGSAAGGAGPCPATGRTEAGGAGGLDRRDVTDGAWRADRGRWRLAAGSAARCVRWPDAADDVADLPCGGGTAGRASGGGGAWRRPPAV